MQRRKTAFLQSWRSRERFPLTSTVKALECARVYELGLENRSAPIKTTPVVPHSPVYGTVNPDTKVTVTSPLIEMRGFLLHSEFGIRVSPNTSPAPQA